MSVESRNTQKARIDTSSTTAKVQRIDMVKKELEASPGIEPGCKDLQSSA